MALRADTSRTDVRADASRPDTFGAAAPSGFGADNTRLRVAINLLSEDPNHPSGTHWFWTRMVPEMAKRLLPGEELHLMLSPAARRGYSDYGDAVRVITFPWSNEHRVLRTASEHLISPIRLPFSGIDVLNTAIAPVVNPSWSLVIHMKTMHAFTTPRALGIGARTYRRLNYQRSARLAEAIIINSNSLRSEIDRYLEVDPEKVRLIYEAVDHDLFKPGNREGAKAHVASFGVSRPFVVFVSSLWRYKNCDGLLHAWRLARQDLWGRQLVIVGAERDEEYAAELRTLVEELGIADDVVFVGGVALEDAAAFYQAADLLVYPSLNETFGLPILEAMACACPVVTSNVSAMPETAGGAALLADPKDPASLAHAIVEATGTAADRLRTLGLRRARQFTWGSTAEATLDVYRMAALRRRRRQ
jgi:glycosyltransferase involved in cell wall biosynthesis